MSTHSAASHGHGQEHEHKQELTWRAVLVGLGIGILLCFTNTYFGLQSGWISMMSLQASLLGFAVFKVLPQAGLFKDNPLTVYENVVLQTTAVATGTLPLAAGLVGVIPALSLLNEETDNSPAIVLSPLQLLGWCAAVAFFGCFLAVPLRRQVIVKEKLVFPSGTATAQVIGILHGTPLLKEGKSDAEYRALAAEEGEEDDEEVPLEVEEMVIKKGLDTEGFKAMSVSFCLSAGFTLVSLAFPVVYAIPLFDVLHRGLAHNWLWWFTPSFSYVGQGIIMGFPTTASMNIGMICGWAFLSPLAKYMGWAPGPVSSSNDGARGWLLWPALAVMMAESILSLSMYTVTTLFPAPTPLLISPDAQEEEIDAGDEPSKPLVVGGVVLSTLSCVLLVAWIFGQEGIKWWATVIALILASIFSVLGVRALGETDLNPVSAIAKISQLLFAVLQPHNIVANLLAGGISEAGAQQAGDLMQDLKTGHLLGASPKAQFYGQVIGSAASVVVSTAIFCAYRALYDLPGQNFPVPTAGIWLNLARLVNNGTLPEKSREAMLLLGGIFVLLAGVKVIASARGRPWVKWIPSGIAFAIGFINTPSFSLARLIGGLISLYYTRQTRSSASHKSSHLENITLIIVASGFVLGEGLASIVGLVIKSAGLGPASCWGCGVGGGGYCGGCP
ncbi:hypothetical protein MNV49_004930 [Pseudohyphozyma bogoriensis]|nr:hypothetical protein MNV49_004930 [Pseudohyphozyma bogoriensis]